MARRVYKAREDKYDPGRKMTMELAVVVGKDERRVSERLP